MFPWEKHTLVFKHPYQLPYRYRDLHGEHYLCRREKRYLDDTVAMKFRKGDIIKFGCGVIKKVPSGWESWFLTNKDKKRFHFHDKITPVYARNQCGIVAGRFQIIKYKKYATFRDYGCIVMMLTGKKAGHIRTYFLKKPFRQKVLFPNKINYKYLIKALPDNIISIFNDDYENTNDGRNLLLSKLYNELNIKGS